MTAITATASESLINFQWVLRDAIQSLFGTNPSGQEIVDVAKHGHLTGVRSIQVAGGTFYDLFARKGRDEWAELETITSYFRETDEYKSGKLDLTALIRGDFLFGYEPQPYDVVKSMVREHAKLGITRLQNFHGMNDARCLVGVARAVQELREEEGYNISAQGVICIEDNANVTLESCLEFAEELIKMGHQGFYLKSASGAVDPEFVGQLTAALYDQYPDQDINVHVHSTYGKAAASYMRASHEAVKRDKKIMLDGQMPAFAGLTSQPSMFKMQDQLRNSDELLLQENCPVLDAEMIKADEDAQYRMRFLYHKSESPYHAELLEAMRKARAPGGASSTLKGQIENILPALEEKLGTKDWTKIQIKIYEMQAEILEELGDLTQVTPFAANTTGQAAWCLYNDLMGNDRYATFYPGMQNYLVGKHGKISALVNPDIQAKALKSAGLEKPIEYVSSFDMPHRLPKAREKIRAVLSPLVPKNPWGSVESKASILPDPTDRQTLSAHMVTNGVEHVINCALGRNKPQAAPNLPFWANIPENPEIAANSNEEYKPDLRNAVAAIGGISALEKLAERVSHLKQIEDGYCDFVLSGKTALGTQWFVRNLEEISDFMMAIPDVLRKHGIEEFETGSVKPEYNGYNIYACVKYVVDTKGEGLFDYMRSKVKQYQRDMEPEPEVDRLAVPKAVNSI